MLIGTKNHTRSEAKVIIQPRLKHEDDKSMEAWGVSDIVITTCL